MAKGRTKDLLHEKHIAETEKILIRRRSYYDAMTQIVQTFSVPERTARRWIETVRKQWKVEGTTELFDRTALRVEMHHSLQMGIALALNRTQLVKEKDGRIVYDPASVERDAQGNIVAGRPTIRANPDLQRYFYGLSTLARLHGLDEPARVKIDVDADLNLAPDLSKLKPDQVEKIREALTVLAGGNLDDLIGDMTGGEAPPKK